MPRIVHIDTLPDDIISDIESYTELNPNTCAAIPEDRTLLLESTLSRWLGWHGIHGYTKSIMTIIDEVIDPPNMYDISLNEIEESFKDAADDDVVVIPAKGLRTLIKIIRES